MFRRNVGGIDRFLRVTLGSILFLAGLLLLFGKTTLGLTVLVVGLLALLSGVVRFCILYVPFGISTARSGKQGMMQACDCAAFMKEMQARHNVPEPPASSEEHIAEPVGTSGRR
jgi:hypothetical protein